MVWYAAPAAVLAAYSMQVVTENRYNKKDVRDLLCYAMWSPHPSLPRLQATTNQLPFYQDATTNLWAEWQQRQH